MKRDNFDDNRTTPASIKPHRVTYKCHANNCPMPGTIFLDSNGVCAWHAREDFSFWPKITQCIIDWDCLAKAIEQARRTLTAPETCANPKAQDEAFASIRSTLGAALTGSGWKPRCAPRANEHLPEWTRRMERFLANRVKERVTGRTIVDDDAPTPLVATMRAALRGTAADRAAKLSAGDFA